MRRTMTSGGLLVGIVGLSLYAQTFRDRVEVELIRVDLLATDSQGRPVKSLLPTDVQIKVDGRPVKIESFEAPGSPSSAPQSAAETLPELPQRGPTPKPAEPSASAPPATRSTYYMAILVDEASSEQSNRQVAL
ncbi:MAG: hypothetical protein ACRD1B_08670, partial [Thermoanaerobaculia bacterium]